MNEEDRVVNTTAVMALDVFTKTWCMNKEATEKYNVPIFRCSNCTFRKTDGSTCLVKVFANEKCHDFPMENFGSMT